MQKLLSELYGKIFRAKCPHGCEHAGEGVLFKFSAGKDKDVVNILEIGLDYRDNLEAVCTIKPGSSDNWILFSVKNEFNPYTYAVHRLVDQDVMKYEIFISREGTADQYPLEEVDSRYEDVEFYVNRPSRKRSRHNSRQYSRSHSRSRSTSRSSDREKESDDSDDSNEDRDDRRPDSGESDYLSPPKTTTRAKPTATRATRGRPSAAATRGRASTTARKPRATTATTKPTPRKTSAKKRNT